MGTFWDFQHPFCHKTSNNWGTISKKKIHKAETLSDGMSRKASSRNIQWSEKGATKWVYSRAQDLVVNLSSLRTGYFNERTKKINEKLFLR